MEDFEEQYSEEQIFFSANYKLPSMVYSFIDLETTEDKFDILIKIARLGKREFFEKNPIVICEVWRHLGILSIEISRGYLDDIFFRNILVNKEKIKFLIQFFEESISSLIQQNEDTKIVSNELNYVDFVIKNLKAITNHLSKYNSEIILKWKLSDDELNSLTNSKLDGRVSLKAPTNIERIKALKEFCPELWEKLSKSQSKEIQQNIIHFITGVNKEDSYKFSFGTRQKALENVEITNLNELKNKEI